MLGLVLELAYPLPGDVEFSAELGEARGLPAFEAVAPAEDVPVSLGKPSNSIHGVIILSMDRQQLFIT
jgi:hypothetical protein